MELTQEYIKENKVHGVIKCCMDDFFFFLRYVKIIETSSFTRVGGAIPFILWPHLVKAIETILTNRLVIWLKSRQIGASWLVASYALWYALFHKGANVMIYSKGEVEAIELLSKCRRIYKNLPDYLKDELSKDSATEMRFPATESSIQAFSSTESSGIGFTGSLIICDEWEQHPWAVENYIQIKPCIDSSGGQFIGIFTKDKRKKDPLATRTFMDAREKKNGFAWLFDSYDVRPGRDEEWYNKVKSELSPEELGGLTPELFMEQNYPRSIEEALRIGGTASAFDSDVLSEMMLNTRNPVKLDDTNIDYNVVNIFKPFQMGHYYISSADIAHGVGKDYTYAPILDVITGEVVADILRNDLSPEIFAEHYLKLLKLYRNPLCAPEDNEIGHTVILVMQQSGYKNWVYSDDTRKKKGIPGWHTGGMGVNSRDKVLNFFLPAVNNRQITIYNRKVIEQFHSLIRNVEKSGRIEAVSGGNDDCAMALAIAWFNKDKVQTEEWKPRVLETLHFRRRNAQR